MGLHASIALLAVASSMNGALAANIARLDHLSPQIGSLAQRASGVVPYNHRVDASGDCELGEIICGKYCYDIGILCCPDGSIACDLFSTCQRSGATYSCCGLTDSCNNVDTSGDDDDDDSGSTPTRTSKGGSSQPTVTGLGGIGGADITGTPGAGNGGISDACVEDLSSLSASPAPTPKPDLQKALGSASGDFCNFKPPSGLEDDWKSYTKAVKSWGKENKDLVKKLENDCSSGQSIPDLTKCNSGAKASAGIVSCVVVGSFVAAVAMLL